MFYNYWFLFYILFNIDLVNYYLVYYVLFIVKDDMRIKFDVLLKECVEMK